LGIEERREREKEQRRNAIIDAAEKVFFSRGVTEATMDEVADVAELSKGTLYLYFRNRDDLFHGIIARALNKLYDFFVEAIKRKKKGTDRLFEIGMAYFEFYKQYPDYFHAMLHQEEHEVKIEEMNELSMVLRCHELAGKIFGLLKSTIEDGIKDGSISPDLDPLKLSLALWGQATGIMQIISNKRVVIEEIMGINPDSLVTYTYQLVQKAIKNE
jgi:AcrR family transcriptional regulator